MMESSFQTATHAERPIPAETVIELYREAGWWPERDQEDIARVIGGGPAVGAWSRSELVGFARAVSDGKFRAYIEDVIVAKAHRRKGIGRQLLDRLLHELRSVDVVSLFTEESLTSYYEVLGFSATRQKVLHRNI